MNHDSTPLPPARADSGGEFFTTRWTQVSRAKADSPEGRRALAEFTGLALRKAFADEPRQETQATGREGKARFNRRGLAGEWREWSREEQGERLASLVAEHRS